MSVTALRQQPVHPKRMAASIDKSAWLEWMAGLMGGVSRQTQSAAFPPDRYYCLLDELPVHLIPRPAFTTKSEEAGRTLFLNPECQLCTAGELPIELISQRELVSGFALRGTIVWVRDAGGCQIPFWLGSKLEALLTKLQPGQPIPDSVTESERSTLEQAGILVSGSSIAQRREQEAARKAAKLFQTKGYAPLHSLIHPFHVAALRRYYRYRIRSGSIPLGDGQSPRRYVAYNDPVARFFHRQIAAQFSAVAGEPLKPSYVYFASYLSGAELKKHIDREQCEFSITLCLDFSPEPALATPWPICLDTPTGRVTVFQALGDGLAYRGTRLPHHRSKLANGQSSSSIFFHYVSADFNGPLN